MHLLGASLPMGMLSMCSKKTERTNKAVVLKVSSQVQQQQLSLETVRNANSQVPLQLVESALEGEEPEICGLTSLPEDD